MKGLLVSVLQDKWIGNCSANGVTANNKHMLLVGEGIGGPSDVDPSEPYLVLVERELYDGSKTGGTEPYVHAVPVFPNGTKPTGAGPMMGGAFIYSSDARFPSRYPIPVHDRWESWDFYNSMD